MRYDRLLAKILLELGLILAVIWICVHWCITKVYFAAKRYDEKVDAWMKNNFSDERLK